MNEIEHQHSTSSIPRKQSTTASIMSSSSTDPPMLRPEEEEEERQHIQKIIIALRYYRKYSYARVTKTETYLNSLPNRHQEMLVRYRNHLGVIRDCIDENQAVIKRMLREDVLRANVSSYAGGERMNTQPQDLDGQAMKIRHQDMENVQSTLKLIARDWSVAGAEEREQSYAPIIAAIEEFYQPEKFALNEIKILVPGAGLGRLTYELACRGYECEGNEFSYFMLIASYFVLNQCNEENKYTLYPWVHQYMNNLLMADQVAAIHFPDVCPVLHPPKGKIIMAAGDFLEVYKAPNSYDCVATCFFIDCASNVVDFVETIYRVLVPGAIWVNLGPLLYHYSDMQGENSIEPTYENLVHIIKSVGFEILKEKTGLRTKYAQNPQSMQKSEYESLFWICRKPLNGAYQHNKEHYEQISTLNTDSNCSDEQLNDMPQKREEFRNGFDDY